RSDGEVDDGSPVLEVVEPQILGDVADDLDNVRDCGHVLYCPSVVRRALAAGLPFGTHVPYSQEPYGSRPSPPLCAAPVSGWGGALLNQERLPDFGPPPGRARR